MTWRMISVLLLAMAGCGGDDEMENAPPLTSGESTTLVLPSATDTDTDTGTGSGTTVPTTSMGSSMMEEGSGTCGQFTVLSGGFSDGGAGVNLPIECTVIFYAEGQVDRATGQELGGFVFRVSGLVIDEYPQSFEIPSSMVPMVECGDEGYVAAECDADGNMLPDDGVGGYFPGLPLQKVTIPAANVFIPIVQL